MKKSIAILAFTLALASCSTSSTSDNDPWARIDPDKAAKQSATVEGVVKSTAMNRDMTYSAWLPNEYDESKTYPFLYLLHGYEDDNQNARHDRCWLNKGNAAKIADDFQKSTGIAMVIIMPNGLNKFYSWDGYEDYFEQELMAAVEAKYGCNGKRAIAGLSMGGYGTLYHALKYPEKFTYAYAMSPAADANMAMYVDQQSDKSVFPDFTFEVGTQDFTVDNSKTKSLYNKLTQKGLTCDYVERDGTHDWAFWKVCLPKALAKAGASFK